MCPYLAVLYMTALKLKKKIQKCIINVMQPNAWLSFLSIQNSLQKDILQFRVNILYFTKLDLAVTSVCIHSKANLRYIL
jgi:hypothetical protein